MRIAYILNYPVVREDGVTRKINTQIRHWKELGHDVKAFNPFEVAENPLVLTEQYDCGNVLQKKLKRCRQMIRDVEIFKPDLIYLRYTYWNRTLGIIQSKYKNVIEINTDDLSELGSNFRYSPSFRKAAMFILDLILRNPVLKKADGLVFVTRELSQKSSFRKFSKDALICPNGYDFSAIVQRKAESNISRRTGLFFIGSPGHACHGIDQIAWLADNLPEYDFHIVGTSGNSTDNLFYHGYMDKAEYIKIMQTCSICISSLAPFRKKITEGSALKVREYIALGYPVILGGRDAAFEALNELPEWVLQLDFKKKINLEKTRDFIERNRSVVVDKKTAETLVGSAGIELKRTDFFNKVIYKQTAWNNEGRA